MNILGKKVLDYIKTHNKEGAMALILLLFCFLVFPYLFSWLHELCHAFIAIINGIEVIRIEVYYPMGGGTELAEGIFIGREKVAILAYAFGSIGSLLIAGIINRILYHLNIRFSVFLPLFIITIFLIMDDLFDWIRGIEYYINGIESKHDAYYFLYYYFQIDDPLILIDPPILQGIIIFSSIVLLVWFVFNLIKIIREESRRCQILKSYSIS